MLSFKEISIGDKALFDSYLKRYSPQVSELTFTNLFMWRKLYKFRYCEISGSLCIGSFRSREEAFMFMPVGLFEPDLFINILTDLKNYFEAKGMALVFKRVPEEDIHKLSNLPAGKVDYHIVPDRDNGDYVYLQKNLAELPGKKYDGKRNHINKFNKLYKFEYVTLDAGLINECSRISREWCVAKNCRGHIDLFCEKIAVHELLKNYEKLQCTGALIKVGERYEAYTIGEMLNEDTAVIHIEKANVAIEGLYTLINREFCRNAWQNVAFINREQDLGHEGLRKAKLSYNPVRLINKYTVNFTVRTAARVLSQDLNISY